MLELEKIFEEIEQKQVILKPFDAEDRPTGIINVDIVKEIIRKHLSGKGINVPTNDDWIPVEERLPENEERCAYNEGTRYMKRLEIAYMTDTIEYVHGYYDGYKWMDKLLSEMWTGNQLGRKRGRINGNVSLRRTDIRTSGKCSM